MNHLPARLSVIVAVLLVAASIVSPVAAQSKSVEVPRRDAEMTLLPNGDVQVVETWEVKFNGGPFTSAFRAIPLNKVDRIDGWSVSDEEHPFRQADQGSSKEPYTFEYGSDGKQVKATWYYPATTDQTRTFKVAYTLHGALRIDPAGDEFYWTFIESDRQYPIKASRVVLHLPEGFKAAQIKATTSSQAGARVIDDQTIEFTGGPFPAKTEWKIRAQFPHGVVKANPSAWQTVAPSKPASSQPLDQAYLEQFWRATTIKDLSLIATAVAGIGAIIWLRRLDRRKAVKPARLLGILLIPGATYTAINLVLGSLYWGSACIVIFMAGFFTMLGAIFNFSRGSSSGGGDWGGGGDFGGGGSDSGGGGSSGFN